jgi:hypothetical protein
MLVIVTLEQVQKAISVLAVKEERNQANVFYSQAKTKGGI